MVSAPVLKGRRGITPTAQSSLDPDDAPAAGFPSLPVTSPHRALLWGGSTLMRAGKEGSAYAGNA